MSTTMDFRKTKNSRSEPVKRGFGPLGKAIGYLVLLAMFAWAAMGVLNTQSLHTSNWGNVTIEAGDTLFSIAQKWDGQDDPRVVVNEIEKRNGLGSSTIWPGEVIQVPVGRG